MKLAQEESTLRATPISTYGNNDHRRKVIKRHSFLKLILNDAPQKPVKAKNKISSYSRRSIFSLLTLSLLLTTTPHKSIATTTTSSPPQSFKSGGYGREEYTNSFTASRDTNISPKEAYDSITTTGYISEPLKLSSTTKRALDVGAGAGVSTQFLWEMGYRTIDAVDWSGDAWRRFVSDDNSGGTCPESVVFYEMDDETFRDLWRRRHQKEKYDAIVFNFAVNDGKARAFAGEMLTEGGRLLAPVNEKADYWLKQNYRVYDQGGNLLWSVGSVGAWDVQFQPDVTQDTCQGIWCPPFNGFKKKKI